MLLTGYLLSVSIVNKFVKKILFDTIIYQFSYTHHVLVVTIYNHEVLQKQFSASNETRDISFKSDD